MGKHGRKHSGLHCQNHHPGCMWGMLHILDYHHVRKMLPYKRRGAGKRSGVQYGDDDMHVATSEFQENFNIEMDISVIEDTKTISSPVSRGSVKSRIKARFAVEMSKRRGKHQRSSTSPAQLQTEPTILVNSTENSEHISLAPTDGILNVDSPNYAHPNDESSSSTIEPFTSSAESINGKKICEACENSQDHMILQEKLDSAKKNLLEQKLKYFNKQPRDSPLYQSKDFLDALDIVNLDRDLLIKALQSSGSPVADHLHGRQAVTQLVKFGSFPIPGSSGKKVYAPGGEMNMATGNTDQTRPETSDNASLRSHILKSRNGNQVPIKRFKNLKQRIKQAINERKKEKHRITMDAFLHKIPYGRFKDVNEKVEYKWKEMSINDRDGKDSPASSFDSDNLSCPIFSKRKLHQMRRTSSLTDSLNRYCELYESTFNRGAKSSESPRLKLKNEEVSLRGGSGTLGRIFSLPDLKLYYYEDSSDALSSTYSDRKVLYSINDSLKSKVQLDTLTESGGGGTLVRGCEVNPDTADQTGSSSSSEATSSVLKNEVPSVIESSRHELEFGSINKPESSPISVNESIFRVEMASPPNFSTVEDGQDSHTKQQEPKTDSLEKFESKTNLEKVELPTKHLESDYFRFKVNTKDNVDLNYVRDILEHSGFMKNKFQDTWHAVDQPVDPSIYKEFNEEEGGYCNNLLLFDLINEVLMEIYDSSFAYCPIPFSPLRQIRPMPTGYHVLEEVWTSISWYIRSRPGLDQSLDHLVSRDLSKGDGWMNLQFDTECAGLEIEDLIFDDLLDEVIYQ